MNSEAERELAWQMRRIRLASAARRSSAASRQSLLDKFDAQYPAAARRRWYVPVGIAAALVLSLALLRVPHNAPVPVPVEAVEDAENSDGFIAVPYVPPLAQGELVHVVHTELHPAMLMGLGVNVDPAWETVMPADLLVGEDGFPRAVRISNDDAGGF